MGGIAEDHIADEAVAREQDSNLPPEFSGNGGKVFRKFRGHDLPQGHTPAEHPFQCAALRLLNP